MNDTATTETTEQRNARYEEEDRLELIRHRAEVVNPDDTVIARIGFRFFDDHRSRDLFVGTLIKHKGAFATVELDYVAFNEMLSDAKYYAEENEYDRDLSAAAKRVMIALSKIDRPWIKAN